MNVRIEIIGTEQHEVIGWRDPSETVEDTPKRLVKGKAPPCFNISCAENTNTIVKLIHSLGGTVGADISKYDSKCTHFICDKPSRSEKMMSCIAAGKWVLHLSYIQKSSEAKRFLDVSTLITYIPVNKN